MCRVEVVVALGGGGRWWCTHPEKSVLMSLLFYNMQCMIYACYSFAKCVVLKFSISPVRYWVGEVFVHAPSSIFRHPFSSCCPLDGSGWGGVAIGGKVRCRTPGAVVAV